VTLAVYRDLGGTSTVKFGTAVYRVGTLSTARPYLPNFRPRTLRHVGSVFWTLRHYTCTILVQQFQFILFIYLQIGKPL